MSGIFTELSEKVRSLLKASAENAPVPADPGDPDEITPDYRVGDASPTEADADEAKDDAAEGQGGEGEEGGEGAPEGDDQSGPVNEAAAEGDGDGDETAEGDGDADGDEGRPVTKSFDEHGNLDLTEAEIRQLVKAYGNDTGETQPDELLHEGEDIKAILGDIVALVTKQADALMSQTAVISELRAEIKRLKAGMAKNDREIAKALDTLGSPFTAPAAAPRGITKAIVPDVPDAAYSQAAIADQIFRDMKAGVMTPEQAMAKCREARA